MTNLCIDRSLKTHYSTTRHSDIETPTDPIRYDSKRNEPIESPTHPQTNAKGGVAAWPDVPKPGATLGNLTPADRHGSVQVSPESITKPNK